MTVAQPDISSKWNKQKLRNYVLNEFFAALPLISV